MGDPKFPRRSYDTPSHPWQGERIKAELETVRKYGLKNKTELWKAQTILRDYRAQSRELLARIRVGEAQAKIEADNLLSKCARIGVLPMTGGTLNDILTLTEDHILGRRLQTLVFRKGLAMTPNQARQLIAHGHIYLNSHRVTVPGYIVSRAEEMSIEYNPASAFTDEMHPMRTAKPAVKKEYIPDDRKKGFKKRPRQETKRPAPAPEKDIVLEEE
jgi:small subunit ribosomal protein S4